ncbi:MAG: transketolase C-terminal domain-containing protein [Candidatus Bruticola sp.]
MKTASSKKVAEDLNYQQVNIVLTSLLKELGLRSVAWRGEAGRCYYAENHCHSKSLASLASFADDDISLCHLSVGWERAYALIPSRNLLDDDPLIIVCSDLSPQMLAVMEQMQKNRLQALIIFVDYQRRYAIKTIDSQNAEIYSYPGVFASTLNILYPPPVEFTDIRKLRSKISLLLTQKGLKILHVLGRKKTELTASKDASSPLTVSPELFLDDNFAPKSERSISRQDLTFEQRALKFIAHDLIDQPLVSCLWTCRQDPGPFRILNERLQRAPIEGVIMQAIGMAACSVHPLIVISAIDMPKILNELFNMAPFPITILLTDAGLTSSRKRLSNVNFHDLAMMRSFEHMLISVPGDEEEARSMLLSLISSRTPGLIRLSNTPAIGLHPAKKAVPKTELTGRCLAEGSDLAFVCLGSTVYHAILASRTLNSWGFKAAVCDMGWLNPLDLNLLEKAIQTGRVVTVEEHSVTGGLASAVSEYIVRNKLTEKVQLESIGLNPECRSTNPEDHGLSMEGLLDKAKIILGIN